LRGAKEEKGKDKSMEYGLRRYDATQRLLWFVFFLGCLGLAYVTAPSPVPAPPDLSRVSSSLQSEVFKSPSFWFSLRRLGAEPLGKVMIYLVWVAFLFLLGRALGLMFQYAGKHYVRSLLAGSTRRLDETRGSFGPTPPSTKLEGAMRVQDLFNKSNNFFLQVLFHPLRRLRVLLSNPQKTLSAERLAEKERRLAEVDWEILWSSWSPFRWLLRLLPLVALIQAVWVLQHQLQPALSGQKDIQELTGLVFNALLPLIQVIFLTVVFSLASGLLKRLDSFYLSGVDALFFDRFLTKLPFQSSDTPILIEMLQKNFQELQATLRGLERSLAAGRDSARKEE
jgi:hypothetical protein